MPSPIFDLYRDLNAALTALQARWYVFGAQAAILYGSSRLTADADATVMIGLDALDELLDRLSKNGFKIRTPEFRDVIERNRVVLLRHESSGMPLDLILGGKGLEEEFCSRIVMHDMGGEQIPVISPEDLVAVKILAGRPKDMDDARVVLAANRGRLNMDLVATTLRRLEQVLDRSDLVAELERIASRSAGWET